MKLSFRFWCLPYIYVPSNLSRIRHTPKRSISHRIDQKVQDKGKLCTVRDAGLAAKTVESMAMANPPEKEIIPDSLLAVLREWDYTWIWESMRLFGNED